MTPREQELWDYPLLMLMQEAVYLFNEGRLRTSWYFLLLHAELEWEDEQ